MRHDAVFDLVSENLAKYWDQLKKGKVDKQALAKLPIGRIWKPFEPEKNKNRRILYQNPEVTAFEPLADEELNAQSNKFWLDQTEKVNTLETIEVKNTVEGTKLVKTFALPQRDKLTKLLKNKSTK